jgi:DHA3 family macrolide efflux protein-like MFS transporter
MRIIGGPTAAFLVAYLGAKTCYVIDTVSFLASGSLIASLALTIPKKSSVVGTAEGKSAVATTPEKGLARVWADMKDGIRFIVHHAALLFVIVALAAGMFVMGCFGPLIAIYVRDNLHASTKTFGITSGMIGLGLLVGINLLNAAAKNVKNNLLVYAGLSGMAFGTLLLAAVPHLAATIVGLFIIGFSAGGIIVPSQTMIQQETPVDMMGRVGSTVMSIIFSAQIGGLILSGILANVTSVRGVFAICAAMLIVLIVAGKLWMEPEEHPATV